MLLLVGSMVVAATAVDVVTAFSAVTACELNVGPGLGGVGPAASDAGLSALAKWSLSLCMIAGRLELYALLVALTLGFWRR